MYLYITHFYLFFPSPMLSSACNPCKQIYCHCRNKKCRPNESWWLLTTWGPGIHTEGKVDWSKLKTAHDYLIDLAIKMYRWWLIETNTSRILCKLIHIRFSSNPIRNFHNWPGYVSMHGITSAGSLPPTTSLSLSVSLSLSHTHTHTHTHTFLLSHWVKLKKD